MHLLTIAQRCPIRLALVLIICFALLLTSAPLLRTEAAPGRGQVTSDAATRRLAKPEGALPDLEQVKNESRLEREPLPPIPSTVRSPKVSLQPWNQRRVGDPATRVGADQLLGQVRRAYVQLRRAHARRLMSPPPVTDTQFVQNFFTWTVLHAPSGDE